jgi:hypothetical protein
MIRRNASILLIVLGLALSQVPQVASSQGKGGGKGQGGQNDDKGRGGGQSKAKGQGKGQSKPKDQGDAKGQARGRGQEKVDKQDKGDKSVARSIDSRGKAKGAKHKFTRIASPASMPQSVRHFATSRRAHDVILAAAVSHAFARGRDDVRVVQF